jgi:hypothetical protein
LKNNTAAAKSSSDECIHIRNKRIGNKNSETMIKSKENKEEHFKKF